jgi:hypothetical protein
MLFFGSGWLLAAVLCVAILPKLGHRLLTQLPLGRDADIERALAEKKRQFSVPWRDRRALTIVIGDSHVELANWYSLFHGSFAVRNCGLSRARIEHVVEMVSAIADREPKNVILMCGVNNLGHKDSVASCVTNYERLIVAVGQILSPGNLVIASVMPLRTSLLDRESLLLNRRISEFNHELEVLCIRNHVQFVDVTSTVAYGGAGLAPELTLDGLHLNLQGYRKLADVLATHLSGTD